MPYMDNHFARAPAGASEPAAPMLVPSPFLVVIWKAQKMLELKLDTLIYSKQGIFRTNI
jgi:hypothetical protein